MDKGKDFRPYRIKINTLGRLMEIKNRMNRHESMTIFLVWALDQWIEQQSEGLQIHEESPVIAAGVERVIKNERSRKAS